jgi:hypothetical protein
LRRGLGQEQHLFGLEFGDAALLHSIQAHTPELNHLAEVQVLANGQDA